MMRLIINNSFLIISKQYTLLIKTKLYKEAVLIERCWLEENENDDNNLKRFSAKFSDFGTAR